MQEQLPVLQILVPLIAAWEIQALALVSIGSVD